MRYMLLIWGHGSEADGATEAEPQIAADGLEDGEPCWAPWAREMEARGVILHDGAQLMGPEAATTVRTSGSEVLVADGPFAETKEQIAGYDVIECADLDEAIYAASRRPVSLKGGAVEVRPLAAN